MNNSRRYAEDLVGALKTEHYNTQRDVANKIYNTNWQNLENQYKNLKDKLEAKRVEENRAFASGLANTAESGYDMARANAQNLANRGLSVSGVQDLADKANTTVKGEQVLKLLDKLNSSTEANIEKLSNATSTMAKEEAKLNSNLADTLGDIGAAQTNAQMSYNAGLADIAGQKDARDMENELAALQRAAQAEANALSRSGNDGVDEKIEEFLKKQAIAAILMGVDPETGEEIDWDDTQKANALKILYNVKDAEDVVDSYNSNLKVSETNEKYKNNYKKDIKSYEKEVKLEKNDLKETLEKLYAGKNTKTLYTVKNNKDIQKEIDLMIEYLTEGDTSILYSADVSDVKNALDNVENEAFGVGYGSLSKDKMEQKLRQDILDKNKDALVADKSYRDNVEGKKLYEELISNQKPTQKYFSTSFNDLFKQIDDYKYLLDEYDVYKKAGRDYKDYTDFVIDYYD